MHTQNLKQFLRQQLIPVKVKIIDAPRGSTNKLLNLIFRHVF